MKQLFGVYFTLVLSLNLLFFDALDQSPHAVRNVLRLHWANDGARSLCPDRGTSSSFMDAELLL